MPSPSAAQDLDEKSLISFVDAIDLNCSSEWGDEGGGSSRPPSSILQAPSSPSSPPSSRQQPPASIRSSNYKAVSHSSSSLTTAASASSASVTSASTSASSRKLPDIALDLSGSPGLSSSGSSSGGHFGANSVSLPSPQHHAEAKKKPFLMASLAIGLNEVLAANDDGEYDLDHDDHHDYPDDRSTIENDRGAMQAKHASFSSSPGSNGRSPKKFQLGLPQKSPSYALAPPKGNTSPTGGNGSKLLPISLGGDGVSSSGGGGGGNLSPHSLLKFDPIMGGSSSKCVDLEGSGGAKSRTTTDHPSPSSYRKTIARRSPLRDRSILGNASDIEFTIAPAKSTIASFSGSSSGSSSPSKLDPLDTESIRGFTFASSGALLLLPERKASMKLPSSSMSGSSSPEKAQSQSQDAKLTTSSSSPDKQLAVATAAAAAQPKFRNPFKKNSAANGDKSAKSTATQDDDIDLLGDSRHSSIAQASVAALAPMDEFNYLSFSPRAGGGGKQSTRDLPSLSLSSEAKDTGGSSNSKSPAKKTKKAKDKTQQQDQEVK